MYSVPVALLGIAGVAHAITSCPTQEFSYTAQDGSNWAICSGTDYQSPSVQIINAVKARNDCAQLCQQYNGCSKAVYDKTNFICHLKGAGDLTWAVNTYYDAIRFVSKPTTNSPLTKCTQPEYNVTTSDQQWSVCKLSDYQGNTLRATYQTSETDCAAACSKNGCTKAVYDPKNLMCYEKDNNVQFAFNSDFVTIILRYKPTQGDVLSYCAATNVTSPSGRGFSICNSSDFGGSAFQIGDSTSADDCMRKCDTNQACRKAVYGNGACFLKDASAGPWIYDNRYTSIYLVNGTSNFVGNRGKWAPAVNMPVVPAGAFIVPEQPISKRILGYSSWGTFEFSGPTGITQFADYDYTTGKVSQRTVQETKHDMFCPGMSFLANGSMVVTGGENAEAVSLYNFNTNTWTRAANMKIARGYQTSTTISDGKIFTIGGSFTGGIGGQDVQYKAGEVYDPVLNSWKLLPGADVRPMLTTYDAEGPWRTDNHAWLVGWKNGFVFQAGPSKTMHWYDTRNNGAVIAAGTRDAQNDAMCGVYALIDATKGIIFSAGGSQSYTNSPAFTRAQLITMGEPGQQAKVEVLSPMKFQRGFANCVVLPNGQVIVTGGQATSLVFTDIQSALAPELWDPATKTFSVLAPAAVPRNYHSVSLLLSDGTVWAAGGGLCPVGQGESSAFCDQTVQHFNGEIFTPPYLLKDDGTPAPKPTITRLASNIDTQGYRVRVGGTLTATMSDSANTNFVLVRIGSATHSVNSDQRRVPLTASSRQNVWTIKLPTDSGILLPGFYYLFAMNSAGTPGVARTVQVTI